MTIHELKAKGLLLFECVSGSRAYGLATPASDRDLKGVYYLPKEQFYGLNYIPQVNNESNDEVYYELGRYVDLLIRNNPNMLEMLASPEDCVLYRHPLMEKLKPEDFLSQLCRHTFADYAVTQVRKAKGLNKKVVNPYPEMRAGVMDFCFIIQGHTSVALKTWLETKQYLPERCGLVSIPHTKGLFTLFYDCTQQLQYRGIANSPLATELSLSSVPKGEQEVAHVYFNQEGYSAYCKQYREYHDWVKHRNEERFSNSTQHGKGYDAKNMMHTIRLLQVAEEILRTGELQVRRSNREALLSIRSGVFAYEELLEMAEMLIAKIETAGKVTMLPQKPDKYKLERVLIDIRTALYKD